MAKLTHATIADVDVKENGSVFVKVKYADGTVIGPKVSDEGQRVPAKMPSVNLAQANYKNLKSSQDAPSMVKATENYSAIIGSPVNRIVSSEKYGNFVLGPTTFTAHPENIRIGGVFKLNGLMASTMPSTIITPIPTLIFDYPMADAMKFMSSLVKEFSSFVKGAIV